MKLYEILGIGGNSFGFGGTSVPALSDNGTNVLSTEALLLPAGTGLLPAVASSANTNSGMFFVGTSVAFSANGTQIASMIAGEGMRINNNSLLFGTSTDAGLQRLGAGSFQFAKAANATPVAYTVQIGESSRGGTDTNVAGANGTLKPGVGTGNAVGNKLVIQRNLMGASGSVAQTVSDAIVAGQSKTLSNTSATTTALASISVPSNSGGGCSGFITVVASDGTNFDSETQSFNVSYVNKATVLTIGAPAITASTAASNSGSTTIGITATAGTNAVLINVTPVFTTIVPTTVTSYIELLNHGTGNVTIQ